MLATLLRLLAPAAEYKEEKEEDSWQLVTEGPSTLAENEIGF
jgi:hypothetical protein